MDRWMEWIYIVDIERFTGVFRFSWLGYTGIEVGLQSFAGLQNKECPPKVDPPQLNGWIPLHCQRQPDSEE
jgi:hypothetical protein